ncbi:sporulation protein YlmC with PRC-barrel domain [Bradyrhizobium japonicum]
MLVKSIIAGLAGTALLATVAVAQTPTDKGDKMSPAATSPAPAASTSATSPTEFKGNWRASKVAGLSVYNDKNESVGSINDLLMDKSGTIKAVVIGVGGFLGVGEHLVAVPLDKVNVRQRADRLYRRVQRYRRHRQDEHHHGRSPGGGGEAESLVSGSRRVQRVQG